MKEYYVTLEVRLRVKADKETDALIAAQTAMAESVDGDLIDLAGCDVVACTRETL